MKKRNACYHALLPVAQLLRCSPLHQKILEMMQHSNESIKYMQLIILHLCFWVLCCAMALFLKNMMDILLYHFILMSTSQPVA